MKDMKKRPASNGCQLDAKDAGERAVPSNGRLDDGIDVQPERAQSRAA